MSKVSVKLLIDGEKKRVVFAEAKGDFVDFLFSLLTLPLGSIVKLLGKQSGLGSLDNLYESVEQLDSKDLQTDACREMLLNSRSAASEFCEYLKIKNIHYPNPRDFYCCNENDCCVQSICCYTYIKKSPCRRCGKLMDDEWCWLEGIEHKGGVFVNERSNFIITDDLRVIPVSLITGFSLLEKLQIIDADNLEERVVEVGTEEALNLLKRALVSKRALTEIFIPNACIEPNEKNFSVFKEEIDGSQAEQKYNMKIIVNKENNNVLFAEVGGDFLNQLLSFLTFPLGFVFIVLGDHALLQGCISNLYFSAKSLSLECFKSRKCKNMLLFPKLASYYGLTNQMLKLDENISTSYTVGKSCIKCFKDNGWTSCLTEPCKHGLKEAKLREQNPKLKNGENDSGGGFVDDFQKFMITDNLRISAISAISAITGMDKLVFNLVEKEVSVDKAKALSLLGAMLTSKAVLSDVFSPKPMLRRRYYCVVMKENVTHGSVTTSAPAKVAPVKTEKDCCSCTSTGTFM